jgi:Deoxyribonuclease NucA/NucB
MIKRSFIYLCCFIIGLTVAFSSLAGFAQELTQLAQGDTPESLSIPSNPDNLGGWEIYPPGQSPPEPPVAAVGNSTRIVASPIANVPTFTVTLASHRNPISVIFYDGGTLPNDGDAIDIKFNGRIVRSGLVLTRSGTQVDIDNSLLLSGLNRISITALGQGVIAANTVGITFPSNEVADGRKKELGFNMVPGQTLGVTVGFPQIAICKTRSQFPCIASGGTDLFPETAQHALEALGIPPTPINTPVVSGRTGNSVRLAYPRFLTLDRPNASTRRSRSVYAYQTCPRNTSGLTQDRDEYPPAVFLENEGSAHIKCISSRDNQQAGNSLKLQFNSYKETSSSTAYQIADGKTIELVVLN